MGCGIRNGAIAGAVASAVPWIGVVVTRGTCLDCAEGLGAATLLTLVFIGAGAGIGAMANAAKADGNLLYRAPGASGTVTIGPILTATRVGGAAAIRW
ncbi:MAG TPA: hypothetical protein VMM93_11650 [Vicinamibacterales bacterium]|nr:hypothetical protein [Vicinamibacterales bacterium]